MTSIGRFLSTTTIALMALITSAPVAAQAADPTNLVRFSSGLAGSAADRCGAGEMCASLDQGNDQHIEIYNEGSAKCQAFGLRVVQFRGNQKLFDYERKTLGEGADGNGSCASVFTNTTLTFGRSGEARVLFYLNGDGTLSARWQGGTSAEALGRRPLPDGPWRGGWDGDHPARCITHGAFGLQAWIPWMEPACSEARKQWAKITSTTP